MHVGSTCQVGVGRILFGNISLNQEYAKYKQMKSLLIKRTHIPCIILLVCLLKPFDLSGQAQQYTFAVPVLDTIYTLVPYSQDSCFPVFDVELNANLFSVTGIDLYLVIDSINAPLGSVWTNPGSILNVGDTLPVPSSDTVSGNYKFLFTQGAGGSVSCRLMAEGMATVPGETYICDSLNVLMTMATCANGMDLIGADTCTVICGSPPLSGFKYKISASGNGFLVDFIDTSSYATYWFWDYGDGNQDSTQNASNFFADSGLYSVCLVVANACGSSMACSSIDVYCEIPQAGFDTIVTGMGVDFIDVSSSASSWFWDFGDGNQSTLQQPFNLYADTGVYNVCLIASNSCGLDTVCKDVRISCPAPVADFTFEIPGPDYNTAVFLDQSQNALTWNWDFGDGGQSTLQNPGYTYPDTGISVTYYVCVSISNGCGVDSICDSIAVTVPSGLELQMNRYAGIIRAWPNPFSFSTTIQLPEHDVYTYSRLLLYNAIGQVVASYELSGKRQIVLHAEHLQAGLYSFKTVSNNGIFYHGRAFLIR